LKFRPGGKKKSKKRGRINQTQAGGRIQGEEARKRQSPEQSGEVENHPAPGGTPFLGGAVDKRNLAKPFRRGENWSIAANQKKKDQGDSELIAELTKAKTDKKKGNLELGTGNWQ